MRVLKFTLSLIFLYSFSCLPSLESWYKLTFIIGSIRILYIFFLSTLFYNETIYKLNIVTVIILMTNIVLFT